MSLSKSPGIDKRKYYQTPYDLPEYFQGRAMLGSKVIILGEEQKFRTADTGVIIPYSVLTGLALLNAQREAIPTAEIYRFIIEYFPNCGNHLSNSCKSSIRNALCKYEFVEKIKDEKGGCCDWALSQPKRHKFTRILKLFENRHPNPKEYGLRDIADWPLIKAGLKGLPSKENNNSTDVFKVPYEVSSQLLPPPLTADLPQDTVSEPGSPPSLKDDCSPGYSLTTGLPFSIDHITQFVSPKLDDSNNELVPPQATPEKVSSPVKVPSPIKAYSPVKLSPPRRRPRQESKPTASSLNGFPANMPFYPFGSPMVKNSKLSPMQSYFASPFSPFGQFNPMMNPMMMSPLTSMASMQPDMANAYLTYLQQQIDLIQSLHPSAEKGSPPS